MDLSAHIVGIGGTALARVIAGAVMVSACIAGPFPCGAMALIAAPGVTCIDSTAPRRGSVLLAQQNHAGFSATAAEQDTGSDGRNESGVESNTTPAESTSDDLEKFTPSEKIEAGQGVDFPYDI